MTNQSAMLSFTGFYLLYSVREILEKYTMEALHIRPFIMILWSGIIGIILSFVHIAVFSNRKCDGFLPTFSIIIHYIK